MKRLSRMFKIGAQVSPTIQCFTRVTYNTICVLLKSTMRMQRQGNMMKPWNGTPNQSMVSCGWLARWLPGLCVSSRTQWSLLRAPLLVFLPGSSESELQQQQRRRSGGGAPASERLQVRSLLKGREGELPKVLAAGRGRVFLYSDSGCV